MTKYIAFKESIKKFSRLAQTGVIPTEAVVPLACIMDTLRNAQHICGPGNLPISVILDSIPEAHIKTYLKERKLRAADRSAEARLQI